MLFNSYVFIFLFLPLVLIGFYWLGRIAHTLAMFWLAFASVFFYGWWDVSFVSLLLTSIALNYTIGYLITRRIALSDNRGGFWFLVGGVTINLVLLAYYKYANFFLYNLNYLMGTSFFIKDLVLPLGISFFTFTQIAFLVDAYHGKVKELNFSHYLLFVTYFPHLIAGPVLHHKEMMPQFAEKNACKINWDNISLGIVIFVLGLAKKVLIADSMANYSSPIFDFVASGGHPMLVESWVGALAYTLQLYFDFSAYSDMAVGLSLMFNVRLPVNFDSPYKATSIIEFWRRWHMTLSRFLRDYLYISLGGNRNGFIRRYVNLLITMLIGGLWHGAGWTFIVWGGLHGLYLVINHLWRLVKVQLHWGDGGLLSRLFAGALTFFAVVVGWVFFRADNLSSALVLLAGLIGMNGVSMPSSLMFIWANYPNYMPFQDSIKFVGMIPKTQLLLDNALLLIFFGLCIVFRCQTVIVLAQRIQLQYRRLYIAVILGRIFGASLIAMRRVSEFLYFQF